MDRLTVSTFPNAKALPLWVGMEQGFFAARGLDVALHETSSSKEQRAALGGGDVQIVQAAVDNALSMITKGHDVVIVMGGESGMNDFIVQPHIHDITQLRGATIAVDSPDTAYALLARKMLAGAGLVLGQDYIFLPVGNGARRLRVLLADETISGAVLNPPFSAQAQLSGLRSLGRLVDVLGPYQAGGAFVLRPWAKAHGRELEAYMAGYIAALRWLRDDKNGAAVEAMLSRKLHLSPELAEATKRDLLAPDFGFTVDAAFNEAGFAAVLAARAELQGEDPSLRDWRALVDQSYYARALASVNG